MARQHPLTIEQMPLEGRAVLLRLDLNVPMHAGHIGDALRIERVLPTLRFLADRGARTVVLSHFGRPGGEYVPSLSLSPLVDALQDRLPGRRIRFGVDCVGSLAAEAVRRMEDGQILLLENLRFHPEEEAGDEGFARELASLGDLYINDAFSCSHRAHASISGIPRYLEAYPGFALSEEVRMLEALFEEAPRPLAALLGGSKISTKLALLDRMVSKFDCLMIGGAMAHGFLQAEGHAIGASYAEEGMGEMARGILAKAKKSGCAILLPSDLIVAPQLGREASCRVVGIENLGPDDKALDLGPDTAMRYAEAIADSRTLVWNGPSGAFETPPFDNASLFLSRVIAGRSAGGYLKSIAGGGDTVSAIRRSGLSGQFGYLSTAGGAFLEWLEGKTLPGLAALQR